MKKVGKTTRPLRYNLSRIPYAYTVEVRNRFKGLDLIYRMPDELRMEVRDIVQKTGIKTIPMKNAKKQNGCLRRPYKASLQTKLVEVMEFQLSYFKS